MEHRLSARDREIVETVGRFKQMHARQIGSLLFADLASATPLDRALRRLRDRGYLTRLAVRAVGGVGGGSTQYIYQLGRAGWSLLGVPGKHWAYRSANLHALDLAQLYVDLKNLERTGEVEVIRFDREQEGWRNIGDVQLTPDAYLELGHPAARTKVTCFIELDRGTEHTRQIKDTCVRYWQAYERWEDEVFPYVLFVVPDEPRRREIADVTGGGPREAHDIFRILLASDIQALRRVAV